jgi:simple sugar transport system permease protein
VIALALLSLAAQAVRISVPYGLAAVGGVCSERTGVVNIALEGILLLGAFFAVIGTHYTGSPWVGVAAAMGGGLAAAALHALATVTLKADQIVSGLAINIMAFGATRAGLRVLFQSASNSPRIPAPAVPLLPVALLLILAVLVVLWRTGLGLALRWLGVLASGALGGLGGAWLAFQQHSFSDQMSGGRGYIALAAMIVGKWHPLGAAAACLLFGAAETAQIRLQGAGAPTQILQALPFVLTILVLVLWVGRSVAPAAVGRPYDPEQEG